MHVVTNSPCLGYPLCLWLILLVQAGSHGKLRVAAGDREQGGYATGSNYQMNFENLKASSTLMELASAKTSVAPSSCMNNKCHICHHQINAACAGTYCLWMLRAEYHASVAVKRGFCRSSRTAQHEHTKRAAMRQLQWLSSEYELTRYVSTLADAATWCAMAEGLP